MVGVPRSAGCILCVRRRVKCDQARPGCGNCKRYGADCPGYDRSFKFVSIKHSVRHKPKSGEASGAASGEASGEGSGDVSSASGTASTATASPAPQLASPVFELEPSRRQVLLSVGQIFWDERNEEFLNFQDWFSRIPDHLGDKVTVDSAIYAFALHMRALSSKDETALANDRQMYTKSLSELQRALNHPVEWKTSETLCAAMVLCIYEMFVGTTNPMNWMKHAGGVGWLLEMRGPDAHKTDWDLDMLASFRGLIIMKALLNRQTCFLAAEEWRSIIHSNSRSSLVNPFWDYMAQIPNIVQTAYLLRLRRSREETIEEEEVAELRQQADQLRGKFMRWLDHLSYHVPPPVEAPNPYSNPLYSTIFTFYTDWVGSLFMSIWASILVLQGILGEWGHPDDFTESNEKLLENVLKSVESTGQGIVGPFRVGYSARMAMEFAKPPAKEWLLGLFNGWTKSFAAFIPSAGSASFDILGL